MEFYLFFFVVILSLWLIVYSLILLFNFSVDDTNTLSID